MRTTWERNRNNSLKRTVLDRAWGKEYWRTTPINKEWEKCSVNDKGKDIRKWN